MKILWNNYLKDSTVSTTDPDSLYPVANLTDPFLLRKYQPDTQSATVTIQFPEDRDVSAIFYGYNNVVSATQTLTITKGALDSFTITKGASETWAITQEAEFRLKDSSGSTVYTGVLNTGEDTNVNYFTAVSCRSVEIDFASNSIIYVGGLAVGDPFEYEGIQLNPRMSKRPRVKRELTDGGQMIAKKLKALRSWQVTIPFMTNTVRNQILSMIETVGYDTCVWADLYDDATFEKPMYCAFTDIGNIRRVSNSGEYTMGFTLEERR